MSDGRGNARHNVKWPEGQKKHFEREQKKREKYRRNKDNSQKETLQACGTGQTLSTDTLRTTRKGMDGIEGPLKKGPWEINNNAAVGGLQVCKIAGQTTLRAECILINSRTKEPKEAPDTRTMQSMALLRATEMLNSFS